MPKLIAALAGFLAFEGELMAGKILLPRFGGASYVWCSTVLFFQIVLMVGYFGSRWLESISSIRRTITLVILAGSGFLSLVQTEIRASWLPEELQPFLGLLPYAGLSTLLFCTTPLLHHYQVRKLDYGLYAWSNGGALAGLICYPFLVEPHLNLILQNWIWAVAGIGVCFFLISRRSGETVKSDEPRSVVRWQWFVLPAISSAILLAATNQLSYEASAGPLTWALPLALFLASYVWAFGGDRRGTVAILAIVGLIALTVMIVAGPRTSEKLGLVLVGAAAAMAVCHTALASSRNENSHAFYVATALSGVVGSLITIFIFPRMFTSPVEFQILAVCMLAITGFSLGSRLLRPVVAIFGVIAIGITAYVLSDKNENELARLRNLYGCTSVVKMKNVNAFTLINNKTSHGEQNFEQPERGLSYYGPESGVVSAILKARELGPSIRIGVIGLGTGTINYWARPEDSVVYYEINPQVEMLARNHFTYLTSSTRVQLGDGRKSLENETNSELFDLIVLDAFTGDGIPTHLLTVEAGKIYRRHLKPGGLLAIHITNSHVSLLPVVKGLAQSMGMGLESAENNRIHWVILSHGAVAPKGADVIRWTDECNSILQVLR